MMTDMDVGAPGLEMKRSALSSVRFGLLGWVVHVAGGCLVLLRIALAGHVGIHCEGMDPPSCCWYLDEPYQKGIPLGN